MAAPEKLKPCPFCGNKVFSIQCQGQPAREFSICCMNCGASSGAVQSASATGGAIDLVALAKKWNTRNETR